MGLIKPLLKRSHHVLVSDEGDLCIGEIPGRSKIIPQPPPWVAVVLGLLDGQHTVPRILKEVAHNRVLVRFDDDDDTTREVIAGVQADGTCWLGGTNWQGKAAMRISVSNWATTGEDAERSVAAIRAVWKKFAGDVDPGVPRSS